MSKTQKKNGGEEYLPLSEVIKACGSEARHISRPTIQRALRGGLIEHKRTSLNSRARFRLTVGALRRYLDGLKN